MGGELKPPEPNVSRHAARSSWLPLQDGCRSRRCHECSNTHPANGVAAVAYGLAIPPRRLAVLNLVTVKMAVKLGGPSSSELEVLCFQKDMEPPSGLEPETC